MSDAAIERILPAPTIKDGSKSILFPASEIATGSHGDATFTVDGIAFTFAATVKMPDGTRKREVLNIQPIINAWLTQMIDETPKEVEA